RSSVLEGQAQGQTFFAFCYVVALVHVEHHDVLQGVSGAGVNRSQNFSNFKGRVDHQGDVAAYPRVARQLAHARQHGLRRDAQFELEEEDLARYVELFLQGRRKGAEPAGVLPVPENLGALTRLQRGMFGRLEGEGTDIEGERENRFHVSLDVEEV